MTEENNEDCEQLYRGCSTFNEAITELGRAYYINEQIENIDQRNEGRKQLADAVALLLEDIVGAKRLNVCLLNGEVKPASSHLSTIVSLAQFAIKSVYVVFASSKDNAANCNASIKLVA